MSTSLVVSKHIAVTYHWHGRLLGSVNNTLAHSTHTLVLIAHLHTVQTLRHLHKSAPWRTRPPRNLCACTSLHVHTKTFVHKNTVWRTAHFNSMTYSTSFTLQHTLCACARTLAYLSSSTLGTLASHTQMLLLRAPSLVLPQESASCQERQRLLANIRQTCSSHNSTWLSNQI